ncbi:MAG: PAS domain-containing protein [Desulfopila sp.]
MNGYDAADVYLQWWRLAMFLRKPENIQKFDITNNDLYPILHALDIGVLIANIKGEVTFYNIVHAEMDGIPPTAVLGRKVTDVYELNDDASLIMRCLRTGRPVVECPVLYKTKNGKIVDTIHNVFPLVKNDKLVGAIHGKFILGHKLKKHGVYWQIFSDNHKPCGGRNRAVAFSVLHFVRPCF